MVHDYVVRTPDPVFQFLLLPRLGNIHMELGVQPRLEHKD